MSSTPSAKKDEFDSFGVAELFALIKSIWLPAVIMGLLVGVLVYFLSFQLQPMFGVQADLEYIGDPTKQAQPSRGGDLGGIAAIAGISLAPEGSPRDAAMATLKSRAFARDFIATHDLMDTLNYKKWDAERNEWIKEPNEWRTVRYFREKVMRVSENPKTAMITVRVQWHDAEVATQWVNQIVELINQRLKETAISETQRSLDHLKAELETTQNSDLQKVIASLAKGKIEALMFADIRDEFAFRTIDGAVTPPEDEYDFPRHLLFLVVGGFVGGLLGAMIGLLLMLRKSRRALNKAA
ncbi:MAG: hypothetical protein AB8G18_11460 [Gammaproteobacteria bacterium]